MSLKGVSRAAKITLIVCLVGLVGWAVLPGLTSERAGMEIGDSGVTHLTIPAIDASAPARTETATFSFG